MLLSFQWLKTSDGPRLSRDWFSLHFSGDTVRLSISVLNPSYLLLMTKICCRDNEIARLRRVVGVSTHTTKLRAPYVWKYLPVAFSECSKDVICCVWHFSVGLPRMAELLHCNPCKYQINDEHMCSRADIIICCSVALDGH